MSPLEFKKAVREAEEWHSLFDKKGDVRGEWAEVCFVPNKSATKKGEPYRYIAIRERMSPGMDYLPFQTISFQRDQGRAGRQGNRRHSTRPVARRPFARP